MEDLLNKGAFKLAKLIRAKQVSPVEVVKTHIDRICEVNSVINAVIAERYQEALAEVKETERKILNGHQTGLLAGVPFTVKESIALKGFPFTSGSLFRKDVIAKEDAISVKYLKQEGAIVLGKTNVPECNFWMESFNKIYGLTRNPYDPSRTPGGSSGGEGAIVGAGGVPFGVGSDIAGSIRMPAAFCGVFGHRASSGIISIQGHSFNKLRNPSDLDSNKISKNLAIGPICRKAEDLYPLIRIMSGQSMSFDECALMQKSSIEDWSAYTFYICPEPNIQFASYPDKEVSQAVSDAAEIFKQYGAKIKILDKKKFYHAFSIWQTIIADASDYSLNEEFGNGEKLSLLKEIALRTIGKSRLTLPGLIMVLGEQLFGKSEREMAKLLEEGEQIAAFLDELLLDNAMIIMPVFPTVAPKNQSSYIKPLEWNYTTLFSALDFPASAVPFGFNSQNLPLSVQIIGNRNQDYSIIMAAKFIEKIKGGWKMSITNSSRVSNP